MVPILTHAVLLLSGLLGIVCCSNILLVPLSGDGSHYSVMLNIAETLIHRGHNITIILGYRHTDDINSSPKLVEQSIHFIFYPSIITTAETHDFLAQMTNAGLKGKYTEWLIKKSSESNLLKRLADECCDLLTDQRILSVLRDSNIDLTVVDQSRRTCPIHELLHKDMHVPYVTVSAVMSIPYASLLVNRIPFNPSYIPEIASGLDHMLSYGERIKNFGTSMLFLVLFSSMYNEPFQEIRSKLGLPSIYCADTELLFINTHFALDFPRPLLPNTKTVGGLTTEEGRPLSVVSSEVMFSFYRPRKLLND